MTRLYRVSSTLGLIVLAAVLVVAPSVIPGCSSPAAIGARAVLTTQPPAPSSASPAFAATRGVDLAHLKLGLSSVANGFDHPLYVCGAGDGSGRLFVVEQTGKIRIIRGSSVQPQAFLDLSGVVSQGGERGLLGLAFAPGYATNGRFYINYTDSNGDTTVQRCIANNPASDTPSISRKTILFIKQPFSNHNGGCLQFGPDRYLYIGMGDGGSGGDPGNRAQNRKVLLGKMLRIDTGDTVSPATFTGTYNIPKTNPYVGKAGRRGEIWAFGLRNPWRFSFDRTGGKLWIGDVGQDKYEEVDIVSASKSGQNYGWHIWEGNHRFTTSPASVSKTGFTFPILEYKHPYGETVVGGYVYRGTAYPALYGTYIYADYIVGWLGGIKRFSTTGAALKTPQKARLLTSATQVSSFGIDDHNELYACGWNDGVIYRVTATTK